MPRESSRVYIRARCSQELKRRVLKYADSIESSEADVVRFAVIEYLNALEAQSSQVPHVPAAGHPQLNEPKPTMRPATARKLAAKIKAAVRYPAKDE